MTERKPEIDDTTVGQIPEKPLSEESARERAPETSAETEPLSHDDRDDEDDATIVGAPADVERDLREEVDDGRAGADGVLVEALCTGCRLTRAKRQRDLNPLDPDLSHSFKHVCHECQTVTWWNPLRVLPDGTEGR